LCYERNSFIPDPVQYEPELHLTGNPVVSINDDIRLVCNATGATAAPDSVDWFFNGQPVGANPRWHDRLVRINDKPLPGRSLISELIIKRATMEDHGHFLCRFTKTLTQSINVHILNGKIFCDTFISSAETPVISLTASVFCY